MTKEEIEIKKIALEIEKIKLPFWKNPAYLTILVTIIIGFSSYYVATDNEKKKQIETLEAENKKLEQQQSSLQKTKVELNADYYQRKFEDYRSKKEEIERSIQLKEFRLIGLEDKLKESENKFVDFQTKLREQEKQFNETKIEYEELKKNVNLVIDEVAQYGPKYANGLIRSPEGQDKVTFIISLTDKNLMRTEIGRFAYGICNQAFDQSVAANRLKLNIR